MIIAPEREEREYETQEISEDIMAKTDANRFKKFSKPQAGLKKKKKKSVWMLKPKTQEENLKISQRKEDTWPSMEQLIVNFAIQTM